jgi:hypothetical protein
MKTYELTYFLTKSISLGAGQEKDSLLTPQKDTLDNLRTPSCSNVALSKTTFKAAVSPSDDDYWTLPSASTK